MAIRKHLFALAALTLLTGCEPPPLATPEMLPSPVVYGQIGDSHFLDGKIMVGDVDYGAEKKLMSPLYSYASESLAQALMQAGYLAADEKSAQYRLDATIRDVQFPSCFLGYCETGSAIYYVMKDIKKSSTVYEELLVVPHTMEYPLFGANMTLVQRAALGGAIGESYAHLLQVLSRKTKNDFK